MQFSAAILDKYIAPGVSTFTKAEIPDMSTWAKESPHWVANFFLNSALSVSFTHPMHAYAFNFLRRAQQAFAEHHLARQSTSAFLANGRQSPALYVNALIHWEYFLGQAWHAYALLAKAFDGNVFDKGDGSSEQRLNALYNEMKHTESRIENGQMLPGTTVPVWLDNVGLRSVSTILTYDETAEILKPLSKFADALMNPGNAKEALL